MNSSTSASKLEFYGFAIYLISIVSLIGVILFAYIPNVYFDAIGITYYPNKHRTWCIILPTFTMVSILSLVIFHFGYMLLTTPPPVSIYCYSDDLKTSPNTIFEYDVADENNTSSPVFFYDGTSIPTIEDIPLAKYNYIAY